MKYKFTNSVLWLLWILVLFLIACTSLYLRELIYFEFRVGVTGWVLLALHTIPIITVLFLTKYYSPVYVGEDGVNGEYLLRSYNPMPWEEIKEIGIAYIPGVFFASNWIYFSKENLTNRGRAAILGNKRILKIRFSKQAIQAVQEFYKGDIKGLDIQTKTWVFTSMYPYREE
ncbi:MAG: hypothetical protein ACYCX2_12135 [Christensenellales bacterium]